MSDELKDQRIPIMMSPSEVKAIDDWMFENRIRSRSEAIRRLCQQSLAFEPVMDEMGKLLGEELDNRQILDDVFTKEDNKAYDFEAAFNKLKGYFLEEFNISRKRLELWKRLLKIMIYYKDRAAIKEYEFNKAQETVEYALAINKRKLDSES